jgi:hypothetical protein
MQIAERRNGASGWFTLGFGLTHVLMPSRVAHLLRVPASAPVCTLIRVVGVCQVVAGMKLLRRRRILRFDDSLIKEAAFHSNAMDLTGQGFGTTPDDEVD